MHRCNVNEVKNASISWRGDRENNFSKKVKSDMKILENHKTVNNIHNPHKRPKMKTSV